MLEEPSWMNWTVGLSSGVALSAVALIGYVFGRSQQTAPNPEAPGERGEVQRAARIARQLEQVVDDLRQDLALHRNQVEQFKTQLRRADSEESGESWQRLRDEAEAMVGPTLELVSQLSTAYDKIRQQSQSLANFTGGRTDPLTGLANSRSLEEHLDVLLKSRCEGCDESAVVVVSIDGEPTDREQQDQRVLRVSQCLAQSLRGEDFAARYGVDDFVVVLPATPMAGASIFGVRLRATIREEIGLTVSCGLSESMPGDTPKSLLARADSASYSARAAGTCQQFLHTGAAIRAESCALPNSGEAADATRQKDPPVLAASLPGPMVNGDLVAAE